MYYSVFSAWCKTACSDVYGFTDIVVSVETPTSDQAQFKENPNIKHNSLIVSFPRGARQLVQTSMDSETVISVDTPNIDEELYKDDPKTNIVL